MKKFMASFFAVAVLMSMFAVDAFAAGGTVSLTIQGAEGKPGDIVEVQVFMDENPGLWACGFDIGYNAAYFQLGDVENGNVFSDSAFTKGPITPTGSYRFYAQNTDIYTNTSENGLLVTLRFKILETAPNGNHNVSINLMRGNNFVQCDPEGNPVIIEPKIGDPAAIRVTESDATAPVTEPVTTSSDTTDKSDETTGRVVTEYVTDDDHYVVRDEDGVPVTQVVTSAVTGEDGAIIYDEDGNPVTEVVTELLPETETQKSEDEDNAHENVGMKKIILIVGIVLLVAAAVVIVIVLYNARKKADAPKDEKDDQTGTDDSDKQDKQE